MPELVNISVGSLPGTSGLDSTTVCPLDAKKSRKVLRISATVTGGLVIGESGWRGALQRLCGARSRAKRGIIGFGGVVALGWCHCAVSMARPCHCQALSLPCV